MSATYSSASLYVGDLHPDVTETLLFEIFKQVGAVASIRVCRDAVTRRSLGYAYVNFHSVVDAERALESLNYSMIKSKPCRIMWSHRDPSIRKSGVGNVFIKNLDKQIDNKSFFDIFSPYGTILSCKVATDENGVSRGYGFVHYERQEEAEQAIAKCNNLPIHGKKIFVGHFIPKKEKREYVQKFTNVYIKNLDPSVDENELQQIFCVHGTITKAAIMRDENSASKGFGFVNFSQPEEAKSAVEKVSGQELKGKTLFVARAQKKSEREAELRNKFEVIKQERMNQYQGVNLYIKNLDDTLDDEKLATQFSPFGTITSSKIMRDEKGNSRGFGFVCYTNPDEATKAVVEMNGRMIGSKPLYVALAQRRDVRRAQLEAQYRQAQGASTGAGPVFYPPGTTPPPGSRSPSFLYPQQMIPRAGWPPGAQTPYQAIPNFVVPVSQRPARQGRQRNNPSQGGPPPSGRSQTSQGGRRGFKYTPNARNSPQAAAQNVHAPAMTQTEHIPAHGQENLQLANLSNASPETSKQILGEHLFPAIHLQEPNLAGKITGMLLESMEVNELVQLIESSDLLAEKIAEAKGVLSGESAV